MNNKWTKKTGSENVKHQKSTKQTVNDKMNNKCTNTTGNIIDEKQTSTNEKTTNNKMNNKWTEHTGNIIDKKQNERTKNKKRNEQYLNETNGKPNC